MKDLLHNATIESLLPASQATVATHTGDSVDLKGIGRKLFVILDVGVVGSGGTLDVTIQESDDDFAADTTTLHAFAQILAAGTVVVDLAPNKRYIRAVAIDGVAAVDFGVEGIIYLEREIPSNI